MISFGHINFAGSRKGDPYSVVKHILPVVAADSRKGGPHSVVKLILPILANWRRNEFIAQYTCGISNY